jgi:hypothetical protein
VKTCFRSAILNPEIPEKKRKKEIIPKLKPGGRRKLGVYINNH